MCIRDRYNYSTVKKMIERQKKKYGWEFLFLGANIDAVETAGNLGIHADRAVTYRADGIGTRKNFDALCSAVSCMRSNATRSADWKAEIEEYLKSKK